MTSFVNGLRDVLQSYKSMSIKVTWNFGEETGIMAFMDKEELRRWRAALCCPSQSFVSLLQVSKGIVECEKELRLALAASDFKQVGILLLRLDAGLKSFFSSFDVLPVKMSRLKKSSLPKGQRDIVCGHMRNILAVYGDVHKVVREIV